jgi:AcrR family transcriptional regulator
VAARRVLTKDDWLKAAMETLRTQGVGGVRILKLATALGVTRGGFYWHFRDRQDLLDQMLDWWDREMTDTVIRHVDNVRDSLDKRILALAQFVLLEDLNRYDTAIRSWACGDRKAAAVLRRVLDKRLAYVTGLFREAGFSPAEAAARGHLMAVYVMREATVHLGESVQARRRMLRRQVKILAAPE